jgi:2,3-bisphosphoglycerate-independent phosphoglycerate mutase
MWRTTIRRHGEAKKAASRSPNLLGALDTVKGALPMNDLELMKQLTVPATSKIVLLVLDGLGGLPREPGGPTELEAAVTPNMDRLARDGAVGLMSPAGVGISPGSGPGHLGLFGYDPLRYVIGRGVLEAVGIGIPIGASDVAARGNFCTVGPDGTIIDRRAGRISTEECARMVALIEDISLPGVEITVRPVRDYRFALIFRGADLSPLITETDPQRVGVPPLRVFAQDSSASSAATAELANAWIDRVRERIKDQHPANMVTLRGWSKEPGLPSFQEVFKLRAAAIAVYPMYKGLASLAGMTVLEGIADIDAQMDTLEREWDRFDFFFIHYKYTDSRGEDGNFEGKAAEIEKVDRVIPRILDRKPAVLAITGDHSTPAVLKSHSWHPVPTLIYAPGTTRSNPAVTGFGETNCLSGALGRFDATQLMRQLTAHALRQSKFGA